MKTGFADHWYLDSGDNLVVSVAKFNPKVVCSPQTYPRDPTILKACQAIVDQMETSHNNDIFAQNNICDPRLETCLPVYYGSPSKGSAH